jgi:hypothetical protein
MSKGRAIGRAVLHAAVVLLQGKWAGGVTMKKPVMCVVPSHVEADKLVKELLASGFWDADISVLFAHKPDTTESPLEDESKVVGGTAVGIGAGGVVGGAIGLLAGLGVLVIPGVGPFLAAGPIMAALSGLLAGAGVGGTTGALIGLGIPEPEAKRYDAQLRRGQVLVSVHPRNEEDRARAVAILAAAEPLAEASPRVIESP